MNRSNKKILGDVREFASFYLEENISSALSFHNLNHTLEVVAAAQEIGMYCNVSAEQLEIVQTAAWFHDCGYSSTYNGHEDVSKEVAAKFLKSRQYPQKLIEKVFACIDATRYPQHPDTAEARIICDADLYHFTRPNYHWYENALRKELEVYLNKFYTTAEWQSINLEMLTNHEYFTDYGRNVLQQFKEVNIKLLRCE